MAGGNPPIPRMAMLDGDIIAYRAAFWAESDGPEWLEARLEADLKTWTPPDVDAIQVALSCKREDNFRRKTLPEYKAHRNAKVSPQYLSLAVEILQEMANCVKQDSLEADDLMGMAKSANTHICVTIDKDLKSVPGWQFKPPLELEKMSEPEYTCLQTADFRFHKQWIMGDSTDNVAGIWKLGEKKAEDLLNYLTPANWTYGVFALYEQRPKQDGSRYSYSDAVAMAKAVRILRHGEDASWLPW